MLALATALAGCAGTVAVEAPVANSRLDTSGLTVVTLGEAVVLARPARRLTAAARDYAYLGPVEINRMGERTHYVWLGLATTVDRTLADEEEPRAATLTLIVDGSPMSLPLTRWDTELDRVPYQSSVPVYETVAARASLDQINHIAEASSVEVHIVDEAGVSFKYNKWQGEWVHWGALGASEEIPEEVPSLTSQ